MTRRRLIAVAVTLALVVTGAAWWLSLAPLSAEEQRLVGVWRYAAGGDDNPARVTFTPDRRARWSALGVDDWEEGRWTIRGGDLVIDREIHPARRVVRPVARLFGVRMGSVETYHLTWATADELTMGHYNGHVTELIRAPAH